MAHRKLAILRRRVFTALSVLSLLLCLATLGLWVRSYRVLDRVIHYRLGIENTRRLSIHSVMGGVQVVTMTHSPRLFSGTKAPRPGWGYEFEAAREGLKLRPASKDIPGSGFFLGFGYRFFRTQTGMTTRAVLVPHWFLALLFAILPALRLRAAIRSRRRLRAGHCPRCGYDLRATPDRCPECGFRRDGET